MATFNRDFKQAGILELKRVTETLGSMKSKQPALVSEDASHSPSLWFLSQHGETAAKAVIAEVFGQTDGELDLSRNGAAVQES